MLRLVRRFGFEGDDIDSFRDERLQMLLSVYGRARDILADVIIRYPRGVEGANESGASANLELEHASAGQVSTSQADQDSVSGGTDVEGDIWDVFYTL